MDMHKVQAKKLLQVADAVEKGEISLKQIPSDEILSLIQQVYARSVAADSELFLEQYGQLLINGLENCNKKVVVDAIKLLVYHIFLLKKNEEQIENYKIKNWELQSQIGFWRNNEKINAWYKENKLEGNLPFEGRGVVYSAITGNYDNVKEPTYINPEWDYILFTNNPNIKSSVWQVRLVENEQKLDDVRLARHIKIMGHEYLPEYDYSIWVDGKLRIRENLRECIEIYRKQEPILCFSHYVNDCVYQEWESCIILQKDDPKIMERQMKRYLEEKYPAHNGMIDSGILIRDLHNERMCRVMDTWWTEVLNGSRRDQLSFNYACWKNNFMYDTTDLFIYGNKYVEVYGHN